VSAVFDMLEAIVEVIMAIVEAIASGISALIEAAPAVVEVLGVIAGATLAVLEVGGQVLGAFPKILDGTMKAILGQIVAYAGWTAVQVALVAFFPTYGLAINGLFLVYTIIGLVQGADNVFGAPTLVAAGIGACVFALNMYLTII